MQNKKILIIEDEENIAELLSHYINKEGYNTRIASNGTVGLQLVQEFMPDLILLDLMLPDISGFEVCKKISTDYIIPIIMITAKSDTVDKVLGMELGADDYITKPFNTREVIARIRSIFRRIDLISESITNNEPNSIQIDNDIEIHIDRREVFKNNIKIDMTNKEYELLVYLAKNKGKVITRNELLDKVWGIEFVGDSRTVDIHIQRVRKKLDESKNSSLIETVFGIGYKMVGY
ncbi:response regulator transcription factor [Clostridium sp. YIM B02505]|uniref:Stage 0 sporulation protein A homolog n=1 Tax=Clostridium yunnanense TaxID=2800325 RepID=A0ABS1EP82_9CLOT|nr:response regulator transcription factor [Clostridium yunnanense]MBK1811186.1 response regulator transcription factor [Clostridium yunnanense]